MTPVLGEPRSPRLLPERNDAADEDDADGSGGRAEKALLSSSE